VLKKLIVSIILFMFLLCGQSFAASLNITSLYVPSSDGDGRYQVSWGHVSNATYYELVGELSGTLYSGTASSLNRVKSNGSYYYKVRACNSSGCGSFSAKKGITVFKLSTPPKPTATLSNSVDIRVAWNSISGANHYYRQVSINGAAWQNRNKYTATTVLFSNQQVRSYRYRVQACNANSECSSYSSPSNSISVLAVPAVPKVSAELSGGNNITVNWNSISGANHYYRQVSINGAAWQNRNKYTTITVLLSNQQVRSYRYRVQACNVNSECSSYSSPSNSISVLAVPAVPKVSAALSDGNNITVAWNVSSGASYYYREVSINSGPWQNNAKYITTSILLPDQQARSYRYRVRACNSNNQCSSYSTSSNSILVIGNAMSVKQFEWIPATVAVGQVTSFYWDIDNAAECFSISEGADVNEPRPAAGDNGDIIYTAPEEHLTQWYCLDQYGNRLPNNPEEYLEAPRTITPPLMSVKQFEWIPATVAVGQVTSFYWDIDNAAECFSISEGADVNEPRPAAGDNGDIIYTAPEEHLTQWYCLDQYGNRLPNNPDEYLEAPRTITPIPITPKTIIFIHTDLLGTPVAETDKNGDIQ
jgi:hypothetical protein